MINSKILFFIGAGFPFLLGYPIMKNFINNCLLKQLNQKEKDVVSAISKIKGGLDLEDILEELEKIVSVKYFFNVQEYFNKIEELNRIPLIESSPTNFIALSNKKRNAEDLLKNRDEEIIINCKNIINKIRTLIFETYRSGEEKIAFEDYSYDIIFNPLLRMNKLKGRAFLPIFTTNYDNSIEDYFNGIDNVPVKIFNGFDKRGFNPHLLEKINLKKEINVFIFHLHGSVYFFEDKKTKQTKYSEISTYMDDNRYKNKIIYPLKDKTPKDEPFFTYYDYLSRCLDYANYAVFIGYSFRDFESLIRIRSCLFFNRKLKIIILDELADNMKKNLFGNDKNVIAWNYNFLSKDFKEEVPKKINELFESLQI